VLRPFPPLSTTLSVSQRRQINEFVRIISPNDNITCVGGAGAGPLQVLRELARVRATTVCRLLAQRVPGVRTKVDIALTGEVQIAEVAGQSPSQPATPAPIRVSANELLRRVLVVARPNRG